MSHTDAFLRLVANAKTHVREVTVEELTHVNGHRPPVVVDVREDREWREGHVDGALHLSRGIIEQQIEEHVPDHATPVVCYCAGGNRSALVADSLQKLGYTNVRSLAGGLKAWQSAGLPLVANGKED